MWKKKKRSTAALKCHQVAYTASNKWCLYLNVSGYVMAWCSGGASWHFLSSGHVDSRICEISRKATKAVKKVGGAQVFHQEAIQRWPWYVFCILLEQAHKHSYRLLGGKEHMTYGGHKSLMKGVKIGNRAWFWFGYQPKLGFFMMTSVIYEYCLAPISRCFFPCIWRAIDVLWSWKPDSRLSCDKLQKIQKKSCSQRKEVRLKELAKTLQSDDVPAVCPMIWMAVAIPALHLSFDRKQQDLKESWCSFVQLLLFVRQDSLEKNHFLGRASQQLPFGPQIPIYTDKSCLTNTDSSLVTLRCHT